jgi:hypothetical protein
MEEKNNKSVTKAILLIILILFMFSSRILNTIINIGKYLICLILIINIIYYLNSYIVNNFIKDILFKNSTNILDKIKSESKSNICINPSLYNIQNNNNRNLQNIKYTTNRRLYL